MKILVVDDDAIQRDGIAMTLRETGNAVVTAGSGEEAIAMVTADDEIGLVMMDIQMPGIGGVEASRRIRALPDGRGQVPIVALSTADLSDRIKGPAGIDGYLPKSHLASPAHVTDAIQGAVAKRQQAVDVGEQTGSLVYWLKANLTMIIFLFSVISGITGALISTTLRFAQFQHELDEGVRKASDLHETFKDVDRRLNDETAHLSDLGREIDRRLNDLAANRAAARAALETELSALAQRAAVLEAQLHFLADRTTAPAKEPRR